MPSSLNPVDLEIIRHRLDAITVDAGETLVRVSGSLIASEASDFNMAIMTADGAVVAASKFIVVQSTALNLIVTDILEKYADNPGVRPGDQFLTNDPYLGALHQADVTVLAPLFAGETLIGWSGCTVHESDVGGPVGGGFNHAARSIFDEPPPIAPIKMVEGGVVRRDLERDYLGRSRTPELNALDLLGQVAANRACGERVAELVDRYGADGLTGAMTAILDRTEAAFRTRLRSLPDGVWREAAFIEHERREGDGYRPNQVYGIRLAMSKVGDRLTLDFGESDTEAPGAVNCAYPALANFSMAAVLVQLCTGLLWAPGAVLRALEIRSRKGTVVDARWPAGVAMSTGTSAQAVRNVVSGCIARMLDASEGLAWAAMASCQSTGAGGMSISGLTGAGKPFHTLFLDELTGGGGGMAERDGGDVYGTMTSPGATPSNVETNEAAFPVLYLARKELADSGGPGRRRGGVGAVWAYRPHHASGAIALLSMAQGLQHPMTLGMAGGEPGSASGFAVLDDAYGPDLDWRSVRVGPSLPLPGDGDQVAAGEILMASSQGGGGFGDPLERDPAAVLEDVLEGLVTPERARADYAVALRETGFGFEVEAEATAALRLGRRRARLGGREPRPRPGGFTAGRRLSSGFCASQGQVHCSGCGAQVCGEGEPIHERLVLEETSPGARFPLTDRYQGSERFTLRRFYCPGCGVAADLHVALRGEPLLRTFETGPVDLEAVHG
jgi:N-methylhydantoinase B